MDMSKKEYQQFVQDRAKKSPLLKDCTLAFLIGGAICVLGQVIMDQYMALGLSKTDASTATSVTLVFLSVLLTGLNLYNKLGRYGGAGTLVPITGFANAVASPATVNILAAMPVISPSLLKSMAGPVIVFGVAASAVYGVFLMVNQLGWW